MILLSFLKMAARCLLTEFAAELLDFSVKDTDGWAWGATAILRAVLGIIARHPHLATAVTVTMVLLWSIRHHKSDDFRSCDVQNKRSNTFISPTKTSHMQTNSSQSTTLLPIIHLKPEAEILVKVCPNSAGAPCHRDAHE